jgi:hypothetical protein
MLSISLTTVKVILEFNALNPTYKNTNKGIYEIIITTDEYTNSAHF